MRWLIIILFTFILPDLQAQLTIYCLPGQGADRRQFERIDFPSDYRIVYLEYGMPEKGQSMNSFAHTLVSQIDTTECFALLGVSLGGMLCVELNDYVRPEYTILISSAKTSLELPKTYRFQQKIPLYKIVPKRLIRGSAILLQPLVEKDTRKEKETFKAMIQSKDALYMKRTVAMIIEWDRIETNANIIHIHGNEDHTLPLANIDKPQIIIDGGSHMMILTQAESLNQELSYLFNEPY